ncbi:hypothetical protein BOTBODRAFT_481275 [Botryobasidium botryosum FD-172 SS1]|uniref:Peptide hydrolase n=1 Tax=Botryobasidium botryosum (strain FD-172 SS1) TaxID=930990 RepID=A0A067MWC4_BOTB1|nr:hypothetical protein BOTBODRAFT_481275 [Botryobasidium botryosum FD-172 SS1]
MRSALVLALAFLGCVAALPISSQEIAQNAAKGLRLLSLSENDTPVWKTEDEKLDLIKAGKKFFDVTDTYEAHLANKSKEPEVTIQATYAAPSHVSAVTPILSTLSTTNMQSYLSTLTAYNNRYYRSSTGAQASQWILSTLKTIASGKSGITISEFTHSWGQSSIIARFEGTGAITVLGAHLDSINQNSPTSGRAPGADDDGTGTVNLLEAFRVLVAANFKPRTPVEFHFYSGEEGGLLGSQAIATNYKSAGKSVKAMMELDMTGYFAPGTREVIAINTDYVDSGLNAFVVQLASAYSLLPTANDTPCGYACSDHASWNKAGFPATFPFEALTVNENPYIHSTSDTTSVNGFSWSHSLVFAKLAVAFAYELGI